MANIGSNEDNQVSNPGQIWPRANPYESNWQSETRRNRIPDHSNSPRRHWITDPVYGLSGNHDHVFSISLNDHENNEHSANDQEHLESNEDLELPPPSYSEIEDINALPPPSYEVAFQNELEQIKHMTVISKKLRSHLWRSTLV